MSNESGSWAQYQKLVLRLLEQHDEKLEEFARKLTESQADQKGIHISMEALKDDVNVLKTVVEKSSSLASPLETRLASIEARIKELDRTEAQLTKKGDDSKKFKIGIITAIVGSIVSVVWSIIDKFL